MQKDRDASLSYANIGLIKIVLEISKKISKIIRAVNFNGSYYFCWLKYMLIVIITLQAKFTEIIINKGCIFHNNVLLYKSCC